MKTEVTSKSNRFNFKELWRAFWPLVVWELIIGSAMLTGYIYVQMQPAPTLADYCHDCDVTHPPTYDEHDTSASTISDSTTK